MHRLLITVAAAVLFTATTSVALADDYPPCKDRMQDHCRVVTTHWGGHHHHKMHHHHHH